MSSMTINTTLFGQTEDNPIDRICIRDFDGDELQKLQSDILSIALAEMDLGIIISTIEHGVDLKQWNDDQFLSVVHLFNNIDRQNSDIYSKVYGIIYMLLAMDSANILRQRCKYTRTFFKDRKGRYLINPFPSLEIPLSRWLVMCRENICWHTPNAHNFDIAISAATLAIATYLDHIYNESEHSASRV